MVSFCTFARTRYARAWPHPNVPPGVTLPRCAVPRVPAPGGIARSHRAHVQPRTHMPRCLFLPVHAPSAQPIITATVCSTAQFGLCGAACRAAAGAGPPSPGGESPGEQGQTNSRHQVLPGSPGARAVMETAGAPPSKPFASAACTSRCRFIVDRPANRGDTTRICSFSIAAGVRLSLSVCVGGCGDGGLGAWVGGWGHGWGFGGVSGGCWGGKVIGGGAQVGGAAWLQECRRVSNEATEKHTSCWHA